MDPSLKLHYFYDPFTATTMTTVVTELQYQQILRRK